MTASLPSHDDSHETDEPLFPDREWREFRVSDAQAAKRIVILMAGIFVVGIVLYSIVVATL
jgi:type IV secretory pathway component VirB8